VCDPGLLCDVPDTGGVVALAGEDTHCGVDDEAPLLLGPGLPLARRLLLCD
jgi:hypothetical protein